jgi:tetratricopeptide (TPR) repeat protein
MQQATAYYQRALALLEQGDAMREIWLRRDLAWTLEEQSHLRRSETEAYRAVAALERLLGAIARSRQEFSAALHHYNVAAEIAQTHGFRVDLAAALNNRGYVYQQQERYAEAITDLTEALRLYAEAGALEGQMNALLNLGVCAYKQQQYTQAIQYEMQALEHCRQQHNRGMELLVCSQLAEAYLALGQVDAARAASEQALQITLAEARLPDYAEAQRIYAEVLLACNEHVAALQQAHAAYDLLRPSLESDQAEGETMAYICETLAHVYMAYGDTAQAARYAAQATTLRDTNETAPEA